MWDDLSDVRFKGQDENLIAYLSDIFPHLYCFCLVFSKSVSLLIILLVDLVSFMEEKNMYFRNYNHESDFWTLVMTFGFCLGIMSSNVPYNAHLRSNIRT